MSSVLSKKKNGNSIPQNGPRAPWATPRQQGALQSAEAILSSPKKHKQPQERQKNQDGGARDSIPTVDGSQSPRISHPEGKRRPNRVYVDLRVSAERPQHRMHSTLLGKRGLSVNLTARPASLTGRLTLAGLA